MNTYVVSFCDLLKSELWIKGIHAMSFKDAETKIMRMIIDKFYDSDSDLDIKSYEEFKKSVLSDSILISDIRDIEEF